MDKYKNKSSIKAKIALGLAIFVMSIFFIVKTMVFMEEIQSTPMTRGIEYGCFLLFIPIFGVFAKEFLKRGKEDAKQGIYLKKLNNLGHTIILISHNLELVRDYCNRVIYLEDGQIKDISNFFKKSKKKFVL